MAQGAVLRPAGATYSSFLPSENSLLTYSKLTEFLSGAVHLEPRECAGAGHWEQGARCHRVPRAAQQMSRDGERSPRGDPGVLHWKIVPTSGHAGGGGEGEGAGLGAAGAGSEGLQALGTGGHGSGGSWGEGDPGQLPHCPGCHREAWPAPQASAR